MFKKFSREDLERIQDDMKVQDYEKDDIVIRQGDENTDSMFFVRSGVFECYDDSSPEIVIAELRVNDVFGELGLLLNQKRALSVRASSKGSDDASLWVLQKEDFLADVEDSPVLQATLEYIQEKYNNVSTLETLLTKVSPTGLYDLAVTSSRPKKVCEHSFNVCDCCYRSLCACPCRFIPPRFSSKWLASNLRYIAL